MKGEATVVQLYEKRFAESLGRLKIYAEADENTDAYRVGLARVRKQ